MIGLGTRYATNINRFSLKFIIPQELAFPEALSSCCHIGHEDVLQL